MTLPLTTRSCDGCGEDLTYFVSGTQYSRAVGIEVRGVYDGVLFYAHTRESGGCGFAWHRWQEAEARQNFGYRSYLSMQEKAQPYIDQWNSKVDLP